MRTKRVWEVLAECAGEGPAGEGTKVFRFGSERAAKAFAAGASCYGRPAKVAMVEVPSRLAARWGI
jgi:hypothetical protein